jgi:hypothetical protein
VAASVGLYGVVWANGSESTGDDADEMIATEQRARIAALAAASPDLLAIETIPRGREAAVLGELLTEADVEARITFCCRDDDHRSDGTPLDEAIRAVIRAGRPVAVGVNRTPPQHNRLAAGPRAQRDRPPARRLPELGPGLGRRRVRVARRRDRGLRDRPPERLALARGGCDRHRADGDRRHHRVGTGIPLRLGAAGGR